MRGCWWSCWKTLETFKTIESTKKYYGKARFVNAGMLVEPLESTESYKPLKIQSVELMKSIGNLQNH